MSREIETLTRSLREIAREPYVLGPYQRDYEWGAAETIALFTDIKDAFQAREDSAAPRTYFMGPIVTKSVARTKDQSACLRLVDGQQRITTLALLAAAIRRTAKGEGPLQIAEDANEDSPDIDAQSQERPAIKLKDSWFRTPKFAEAHQPRVLADPERAQAFLALENDGRIASPSGDGQRNLERNFDLLCRLVVSELEATDLKDFLNWIADNIIFAEVRVAGAQSDFVVFDAMNSRGKPLEPLSRFMATFSASITPNTLQEQAQTRFQNTRLMLAELGEREDIEFVKSWAIARCVTFKPHAIPNDGQTARSKKNETHIPTIIRESIQFVQNRTEFRTVLGLNEPQSFVETHWQPYSEIYIKVKRAYKTHNPDLDELWFLAKTRFESAMEQFDESLFIAACPPGTENRNQRLRLVAKFLEIIAARDSWCRLSERAVKKDLRNKDRLQYFLARAAAEIRGKAIHEQANVLKAILNDLRFGFDDVADPAWKGGDAKHARMILAGLTVYLERLAGRPATLAQYGVASGAGAFEIEHLLPSVRSPQRGHGFQEKQYQEHRARLCCLVLIPKAANRDLRDLDYDQKISRYSGNSFNALVKTLFGAANVDPPIRSVLEQHDINFPNVGYWRREIAAERQKALVRLANLAWSPARLDDIAAASAAP